MRKQKADIAHVETDGIIEGLEKKLKREYRQATKDTSQRLSDYMKSFSEEDRRKRLLVAAGKMTGKEYNQWRMDAIATGKHWVQVRDGLAVDLYHSDQMARQIVSGAMPEVYAVNHNYATYLVESGARLDTSYSLYSADAVARIVRDNPKLIPSPSAGIRSKRAVQKAITFQSKKLQSATVQSILAGDSIEHMANRIAQTVGVSNFDSAVRYARTAATCAENAGRMDAFERAEDMGVVVKKTWVATLDDRTREAHADLDGQTVDVDEPFDSELGDIMYPGDPDADPANVWNCRCTMITQIEGYERDVEDLDERNTDNFEWGSYDEWKAEHDYDG